AVQLSRPRWGYGADLGGARAPWIMGGMVVLAAGATLSAVATALLASSAALGLIGAVLGFTLIGVGVGAAGTNLLALLATRVAPARKAAAAAIVWIMMILGFVVTAGVAGQLLDPFSMGRLIGVAGGVSLVALLVAAVALWGVEGRRSEAIRAVVPPSDRVPFREALGAIWNEGQARRFTIFIFASMIAYSAQDLILEPFAGFVHGYTPGESTKLSSVQNGGVLMGMIATAIIGTIVGRSRARFMRIWTMGGCVASGAALLALAYGAQFGAAWPLQTNVFALGVANGAFAVAAIGSMMTLASVGQKAREGTRMGLWGASQAIAFGLGGFIGAVGIDFMRTMVADVSLAFAAVFAIEGFVFLIAAYLAVRVGPTQADNARLPAMPAGEHLPAE
ncbi:MAG: BCD family MFS transporter, partial [Pseudomonadota bacterium]